MSRAWPQVALGEVLTQVSRAERVEPAKEYRLLGVRLEGEGPFLRETKLGSQSSAIQLFKVQEGDFIYSRLFAWRGAFGVVGTEHDGCYVSNEFPTFRPVPEKIDVRFLRYWFRLPRIITAVEADCSGSTPLTRNRFKEQFFLSLKIPLPPLAEQQRILARIEELAAKIDKARGLRRQAVEEAEALFRAGSALEFRREWQVELLENICSLITDGTHQTPRYVDNGYTFLSAQNVKPYRFMPDIHRKVSYEDYIGCQKRARPQKGDVLLTRVGAGIGEAAVLDRDIDFAFYVSLALIRPIAEKVIPEFLVHWLNSPVGLNQSRAQTLGKGHSQGNLNLKLLRKFSLPLPPLLEQRRTVAYLDDLQAKFDSLKRIQIDTTTEIDAMLPSILDKAFSGKL